jgi:hypothetical protein
MKHSKPTQSQGVVVGMAWYRPEEWPELLAASVDRDALEETHAEWLAGAENAFLDLVAQGVSVKKVDVSVDDLVDWCRKNDRPVNGKSRAAYTTFKLSQTAESSARRPQSGRRPED